MKKLILWLIGKRRAYRKRRMECFVDKYARGVGTEGAHERFVKRVKKAGMPELERMAEVFEARSCELKVTEGPTKEMVDRLEAKIDKLEAEKLSHGR